MKDTLSPATERTYKACLRKIDEYGTEMTPEEVKAFLATEFPNPNSRRVYLSALLWKHKSGVEYDSYRAEFDKVKKLANQEAKKQELPEARKDKYIEWTELLRIYAEQKHTLDPQAKVLAACYLLNPPLRADYADMEYVKRMPKVLETNYCLLRKKNPVFILNHYKTVAAYGTQEIPIHKELVKVLTEHHASGAKVVYEGNRNSLSHYIRTLFKNMTGKEMGIGLLRHSYITKFYESNPSIAEKEKVANLMLHSYTTGELYREVDEDNT